jgi:hypothetical protein
MYMRKAIVELIQQVHIGVVSISPGKTLSQNAMLACVDSYRAFLEDRHQGRHKCHRCVVSSLFTECKRQLKQSARP